MTPPDPVLAFSLLAIAALLAAAAAAWILRRAVRNPLPETEPEVRVYRDQLAELDRDLADGRINEVAHDSARLEIGRRLALLKNERIEDPAPRTSRTVLGGVAALVAIVAGGLYLATGRPGYGDQPFAARRDALLARPATSLNNQELIILLQSDAQKRPDDPRPHLFLGRVLAAQDRDADAVRAYQAAFRRDPKNGEPLAEAGASLVRMNNNKVGPDAVRAFQAALSLSPDLLLPKFYLPLGLWQAGQQDEALAQWRATWNALPSNGDARRELAGRIAQALSTLDRGPGSGPGQGGGGPMEAFAQGGDPTAMIQSMLGQRAERLAVAPKDLGLRISLARATVMSQDKAKAKALLDAGRALYPGDAFVNAILDAATGGLLGEDLPPAR